MVRKTKLNLCSFVLDGILGLKQKANLKAACSQLVCYTDTLTQFCYGCNVELGKNNIEGAVQPAQAQSSTNVHSCLLSIEYN